MKLLDSFGVSIVAAALQLTFPGLIEGVETTPIPSYRRSGERNYSQTVLRVGKPSGSRIKPTVVFVCGLHGRELMNTQAAMLLIHGLLHHYTEGLAWDYSDQTYRTNVDWPSYRAAGSRAPLSREDVRRLVEDIDLLIVLNANPNGRDEAFESAGAPPQERRGCAIDWFNRFLPGPAPGPTEPGPPGRQNQRRVNDSEVVAAGLARGRSCTTGDRTVPNGVDLNRNFSFLHGVEGRGTHRCNTSQFCGPSPASEIETQNIMQLLDDHPLTRCFVDIHSWDVFGGNGWIIHPWAHSVSQSTNPGESVFVSNPYNDSHYLPDDGPVPDHNEYMPPADRDRYARISSDAIAATAAAGLEYTKVVDSDLIDGLYPVTGGSNEYAYARQFLGINADNPCDSWALETGKSWWEQPGTQRYNDHINGAIACLTAVAKAYLP